MDQHPASRGRRDAGGASKLTGDVTQIISQLPPVLESLTGISFEKLMEQVPALRKAMEKEEAPTTESPLSASLRGRPVKPLDTPPE